MGHYRARPVHVDAFRITSVHLLPGGGADLITEDGVGRYATGEMTARMTPAVGDYWVIQEDGYEYLNPKAVFERKYVEVVLP